MKTYEFEEDLDLFLNGPNFTLNEILITILLTKAIFLNLLSGRYIFQLTNYEHKGASESIDFDDTNFSSVGLAE